VTNQILQRLDEFTTRQLNLQIPLGTSPLDNSNSRSHNNAINHDRTMLFNKIKMVLPKYDGKDKEGPSFGLLKWKESLHQFHYFVIWR